MTEPGFSNVTDFLLSGKDPARIALKSIREEVTYGELQRRVDQIANLVLQMGGRKGDRVLLVCENSLFWVAAYLGTMRAGRVCVPLSTSVSPQDFEHVVRVTDVRVVFTQREFVAREKARLESLRVVTEADFADLDANAEPPARKLPSIGPEDLAALMFTSGSTGQPRGVMISHRNIIANTGSIIQSLHLTENDRIIVVLPFYYCFGTSLLHTHLRVGGSLVLETRFMYPEVILQRMAETECTGFAGVPSHFQILLRKSGLRKKTFPHLRYVQQAGGYLAPAFVSELREALPNTSVYLMYGQTEATARLSCLPPELLESKQGSIGKGIPGVELHVVNEWGEDVEVGELGEIVARGANIARGYWCAPQESAYSFRDGALRTGDLATVDEEGFVYIIDRAKDFLKCGGERVSCRQVEEQLLAFEEVLEAAVIGVPDDVLGESVKAFVVPRNPDCDGIQERLALFCKTRMAPRLVPREVVVLSELPKSSSGKVLKASLRVMKPV